MPSRTLRIAAAGVVAVVAVSLAAAVPAAASPTTVISLTFDDGSASQYSTLSMLQSRGMVGTYYINSAMVGSSSYYMTWPQIHDLANAGNEIGGHTLHHTNLTNVDPATARKEVCDDRANLINQGFAVTSFAYPEAAVNSTAETIVHDCGYASGRDVGNLYSSSCPCAYAETIPPADPYRLRTADGATSTTTLADLEASVTNAEAHGGGWVTMVFHGICDNSCTSTNTVRPAIFTAFLDWLEPRSAQGTVVRRVDQVMGGTALRSPTTTASCNGSVCVSGWYRTSPVTVTLNTAAGTGGAVQATWYTTDGTDPVTSATRTQYTGAFDVVQSTVVKYYSTDIAGDVEQTKTQRIQIDTVKPTVSVTSPGSGSTFTRGTKVLIAAAATDAGSGMRRVVFFLDGKRLTADFASPYQYTWNTRYASVGQHVITAVARDVAGNRKASGKVYVTVNS